MALILLITLVGLFTRNLIGIAFFRLLERFFEKIPVVKSVFSAVKQIAEVGPSAIPSVPSGPACSWSLELGIRGSEGLGARRSGGQVWGSSSTRADRPT